MSNENLDLRLIVDISAGEVDATRQDFESEGYKVEVKRQGNGAFAVAAAKCE